MTDVLDLDIPGTRVAGCSRFELERLRAGELEATDAARVRSHLDACAPCAAVWSELDARAARFRESLPFERFEAAVTTKLKPARRRPLWRIGAGLALAASVALGVMYPGVQPVRRNTLKGDDAVDLYVGGTSGTSRLAQEGETLSPGERVRVSYKTTSKHYVMVLSIDETGAVTPIYPEHGASLPVEQGAGPHLLPDSVEFTGHGVERVITLLSDEPLQTEAVEAAATQTFRQAGSLTGMGALPLPAEQMTRSLHKP